MNREVSFGRWLRKQRKALDLTQEDLAQRVKCAPVTIRKIEAGERRPSIQIAKLLAEHLEIQAEDYTAFMRLARMVPISSRPAIPVTAFESERGGRRRNNLPVPLTSLLGREEDVANVSDLLLNKDARLLSLIGPPGVGKTRLGIQVATTLLDNFNDGAFFVALAPVRDPDLVVTTIAQVLGLVEAGSEPLNLRLSYALEDKKLLLLIDNFEHVLSAAPLLVELLAACPRLMILVTSREALRVSGEQVFQVQPLALPDLAALHSTESIGRFPSVALFVERARVVKPNFRLTGTNATAVAAICLQLDGLPLAIELVAAYAKIYSPQTLLTQLSSRLKLSTRGVRDLPDRQKTLWTAIDWSYDLLSPDEQKLFERLSVFVGFTLEGAAKVCNVVGDLDINTLDGIMALLDKSLLQQVSDSDDEPRFTMLETIREYGQDRLARSSATESVRQRHAQLFLEIAETAEPFLRGPEQGKWLALLDVEQANLGSALKWTWTEAGDIDVGVRLVGALWWFWYRRGYTKEGRYWSDGTLERANTVGYTLIRASAIQGAGVFAWLQGDFNAANILLEESLVKWKEVEDKRGFAYSLNYLGLVSLAQGDAVSASTLHEEGMTIFREVTDRWGIAFTLRNLGMAVLFQGNAETAQTLYEESLVIFREVEDQWGIAVVLNDLGEAARSKGNYERAAALYNESLDLFQQVQDRWLQAIVLHNLAYVAQHQGDYNRSVELVEESLAIWRDLGNKRGIALCLVELAGVAIMKGQPKWAVRLFGAVDALLTVIGNHMNQADNAEYNHNIVAIKAQLDEATFNTLWAEGQKMALEQVTMYI